MLKRVDHLNGVVTFQSEKLQACGVPHGFTTRIGGVSKGAYASLNLGSLEKDPATDANTNIAENFRRLREALAIERYPRIAPKQVHGGSVWPVPDQPVSPSKTPEADGLVTQHPRQMLCVRTADCVPILLSSRDGKVVGAVHAGWRGIVVGVVSASVIRLAQTGYLALDQIVAAIGPGISQPHFQVGAEVAQAFEGIGLCHTVTSHHNGKANIDLHQAVYDQLVMIGLDSENIDTHALCTYSMPELFFSHRRDAGVTGRMASVIAVSE